MQWKEKDKIKQLDEELSQLGEAFARVGCCGLNCISSSPPL